VNPVTGGSNPPASPAPDKSEDGVMLIPVTGVSMADQMQSVAKYLGLLVIGMAILLESLLRISRKCGI